MHFFWESDIPNSPRLDTNYSSLLNFSQQSFGQDQATNENGLRSAKTKKLFVASYQHMGELVTSGWGS